MVLVVLDILCNINAYLIKRHRKDGRTLRWVKVMVRTISIITNIYMMNSLNLIVTSNFGYLVLRNYTAITVVLAPSTIYNTTFLVPLKLGFGLYLLVGVGQLLIVHRYVDPVCSAVVWMGHPIIGGIILTFNIVTRSFLIFKQIPYFL